MQQCSTHFSPSATAEKIKLSERMIDTCLYIFWPFGAVTVERKPELASQTVLLVTPMDTHAAWRFLYP